MLVNRSIYWKTYIDKQYYLGKIRASQQDEFITWANNNALKIEYITYFDFFWPVSDHQLNKKHVLLMRQLESLMQHMQLLQHALYSIQQNNTCPWIAGMILLITTHLQQGTCYYQSLQWMPYIDTMTTALIKTGELTQQLTLMMQQIQTIDAFKTQFKTKIQQVMFYPCIVLITALIISLFLILYLLPIMLTTVAQSRPKSLPFSIQYLMMFNHWIHCHTAALLLTILWILYSLVYHKKTYFQSLLQRAAHCRYLKLSEYIKQYAAVMWCFVLGHLIQAQYPLLQAIKLCQPLLALSEKQEMHALINDLTQGMTMSSALKNTSFFPDSWLIWVTLGEQKEQLGPQLIKLAKHYYAQQSQYLDWLQKILEPLMMFVIAAVITGLLIGLYLPLFQIGNYL